VPVDVVAAADVAVVGFGFDAVAAVVVAAAAAVVAAMPVVDDDCDYDYDYDDDSAAFLASRISAYKDRAPAEAARRRPSGVESRSADSGYWSRDRGVAAAVCFGNSGHNRDSSGSAAFASVARPSHTTGGDLCDRI